jgi:hypothetical protein
MLTLLQLTKAMLSQIWTPTLIHPSHIVVSVANIKAWSQALLVDINCLAILLQTSSSEGSPSLSQTENTNLLWNGLRKTWIMSRVSTKQIWVLLRKPEEQWRVPITSEWINTLLNSIINTPWANTGTTTIKATCKIVMQRYQTWCLRLQEVLLSRAVKLLEVKEASNSI